MPKRDIGRVSLGTGTRVDDGKTGSVKAMALSRVRILRILALTLAEQSVAVGRAERKLTDAVTTVGLDQNIVIPAFPISYYAYFS